MDSFCCAVVCWLFFFALVADCNKYLAHYIVFNIYFQVQKKNYRQEKKRAAKELFSALKDPSVVIISNWLKVEKLLLWFSFDMVSR